MPLNSMVLSIAAGRKSRVTCSEVMVVPIIAAGVLSLLSAVPSIAAPLDTDDSRPSWIEFTSPDHKFSARFPGSVHVTNRPADQKGISASSFTTTTYASCMFRIDDNSYPANFAPPERGFTDRLIDASQAADLKALDVTPPGIPYPVTVTKLRNSVIRMLAGRIQGREFIGNNVIFTLTERIFVTDEPPNPFEEFTLKVLCKMGYDNTAISAAFLDSFQLLGR
jgi:hypothetical protein